MNARNDDGVVSDIVDTVNLAAGFRPTKYQVAQDPGLRLRWIARVQALLASAWVLVCSHLIMDWHYSYSRARQPLRVGGQQAQHRSDRFSKALEDTERRGEQKRVLEEAEKFQAMTD